MLKLPAKIDPATPVGELTTRQLRSLAFSIVAQSNRTNKLTPDAARSMANARAKGQSKKERSEIAKAAAAARWAKHPKLQSAAATSAPASGAE